MNRRTFLASLSATLARAAARLPANDNIRWALSLGLWNHFRPVPFTDILDVMRDTGFIGIRLTGFPDVLRDLRPHAVRRWRRKFPNGNCMSAPFPSAGRRTMPRKHDKIMADARRAMAVSEKGSAPRNWWCSRRARLPPGADLMQAFDNMADCYTRLGDVAGELGFRVGLHNHLGEMVENSR